MVFFDLDAHHHNRIKVEACDWLTDEAQYSIESRSDYYNDGDWQSRLTYFLSALVQCRVTNHKPRP